MRRNPKILAPSLLGLLALTLVTGTGDPAASAAEIQHAEVWDLATGTEMWGYATLIRGHGSAVYTIANTGLRNHTMTIWAVYFNSPENCFTAPCTIDDLFDNPDSGAGVEGPVDGNVIRTTGGTFEGRLLEGDTSRTLVGAAFEDSHSTEVHFVGRSHGPPIPGHVVEQVGAFNGGCMVDLDPGTIPAAAGECADVFFAIFPGVN